MTTFEFINTDLNITFYGYLNGEVQATLKHIGGKALDKAETVFSKEEVIESGFYRTDCPSSALKRAIMNKYPMQAWVEVFNGFKRTV